ncbi:MAG: benzoyl-CoA reductase subunit [Bacteroidota bacterium]|nr:benzoyl-CoA reductase subunit [Bacteroidota bacterium]
MDTLGEIIQECRKIVNDDNYTYAKQWRRENDKRVLIGIIPNYIPREIIHAANGLAVGIIGSEFRNPNYQNSELSASESCSMLTGIFELVNSSGHEEFDGFVLPSQCRTLKTFKEIIELNSKHKFIKFMNFPQYFQTIIGDIINHHFVHSVLEEIFKINGIKVTAEMLNSSIQLYRNNLKMTERIYSIRQKYPEKLSQEDLYNIVFAGLLIPIESHNDMLGRAIDLLLEGSLELSDNIFEFFSGAFC